MKSCLLAFDCSGPSAGLALLDLDRLGLDWLDLDWLSGDQKRPAKLNPGLFKIKLKEKKQNFKPNEGLIEKTWDGFLSDQLPLKIKEAFEEAGLFCQTRPVAKEKPEALDFRKSLKGIVVGIGPGRWTGIRMALSAAKSLSYSLQIPICPVSSLQALAESYFEEEKSLKASQAENLKTENLKTENSKNPSKVYVSLQAFKNQVYHGEFYRSDSRALIYKKKKKEESRRDLPKTSSLLDFKDWRQKIIQAGGDSLVCLSDLPRFYKIKTQVLEKIQFKPPKLLPPVLIKIALKEGQWIEDYQKIQPDYMRLKI